MKDAKIFVLTVFHLSIIAIAVILGLTFYNSYTELQKEYEQFKQEHTTCDQTFSDYQQLTKKFQENQTQLMIIKDWYEQDGYDNPEVWIKDFQEYKNQYADCDIKLLESENKDYITDEQKIKASELAAAIKKSRSITEIKQLIEEFNKLCEEIEQHKNEILYNQSQITTGAYSWTGYGNSYDTPSSGLTQQSGVNYHDGRTETYYSSNVLYHYRTSEWSVDSEGFYRDSDGNYVVAASDKGQGDTFEGSKGQCKVYDSGCVNGVTDYYVAW